MGAAKEREREVLQQLDVARQLPRVEAVEVHIHTHTHTHTYTNTHKTHTHVAASAAACRGCRGGF